MGASRRDERDGVGRLLEHLHRQLAALGDVQRYWLAYSGGLDSSVLLAVLAELRRQAPDLPGIGRLAAVHVDHDLHPASGTWAEHCAARCAELAIPLMIDWPDLPPTRGTSIESWARAARRAIFGRLLMPGEVLLLAQHGDDQAETLLLALLRGSGPAGLAAMPALAPLGAGRLFRPFLDLDRALLVAYAQHYGLFWIDDPSNAETRFDRNYLRHQILPHLRARWPATVQNLVRSARLCAEAAELSERLAAQTLEEVRGALPGTLSIAHLMSLDPSLAKAVIRLWLSEQGFQPPDAQRLKRLLTEFIPARADAYPLIQWSGCEIRRYRDLLLALPPFPPLPSETTLLWLLGERSVHLELPAGLGRLVWEPLKRWRDVPILTQVRFGQWGRPCRARPGGARRDVKKLFQEAGIPAWLRPRWPMLFCNGRLIAIAGITACHPDGIRDTPAGSLTWQGCPWQQLWPGLTYPLSINLD
ncbi:tRNA lysidine(34) synthetase TilS [Caldichromatium japonicum]|uniref:tRNA(Ile)-lysidine synthase n=1 Tax=Caldichromatium japonicum TaxID=2699430 RepID=A0A6G7VDB9_9GAMM|nr:tRNA lysidine(34) synthetase TilS [Caldichromatium japonicum]QIK37848.1 tRNA lysidine(34) synthetase TilS [Caldichromatium japonicum]